MREVFDTANRQNTSIYAVDPRGLAAFEYDINAGVGLTDRHEGAERDDRLAARARRQHRRPRDRQPQRSRRRDEADHPRRERLLPARLQLDAGADRRQVPRDQGAREAAGTSTSARARATGPTPPRTSRARRAPPKPDAPSAVTAALNAIAEPPRGRAARFWIGTAQGDERRAAGHVRVGADVARGCAGARRRERREPVMLTATAPDGRPVFRGRIPEEGAAPAPHRPTMPSRRTSAAARRSPPARAPRSTRRPGQLQLRMVVENSRGQVIDSATQELTVPDFSKVQVSFEHAARLSRVGRPGAAGDQGERRRAVRSPIASSAAPSACCVRVDGYSAGRRRARVTARLLNRGGTVDGGRAGAARHARPGREIELGALVAGRRRLRHRAQRQDRVPARRRS